MNLTQLRHVAELAELTLTPDEEARLADEVGRILTYVAELEAVDTTDVQPTAQGNGAPVAHSGQGWRPDVAEPGLSHEDALAQAPCAGHEGFVVPSFVE